MLEFPAVVVHGPEDLRAALAAGRPLVLLSAPGAALYAGALWWRALVAFGHELAPGRITADVLDCADAAGRALEALARGQAALVLDPGAAAFAEIAAVAAAQGALLLPVRPPALDLGERGAARRLAAWLAR